MCRHAGCGHLLHDPIVTRPRLGRDRASHIAALTVNELDARASREERGEVLHLGRPVAAGTDRRAKSGIDDFYDRYRELSSGRGVGFFQIGGGIAGDFPICVVPSIKYDLDEPVKPWAYFCQISESTTSYGTYSGATPNEKITWDKLTEETPMFVIESDATIVAP
jgi:hypothetical protein